MKRSKTIAKYTNVYTKCYHIDMEYVHIHVFKLIIVVIKEPGEVYTL